MAANKSARNANLMFSGLDLGRKDPKPVEVQIEKEVPVVPETPRSNNPGGRPRKFKQGTKTSFINVQLTESDVRFLEDHCGRYGGKGGYIRYLIEKERRELGEI